MTSILFSILLTIVGIFLGIIIITIINYMRGINASKKADEIIEKAKKEADKSKRDAILEAKEEAYKIKIDTDKDVKERKKEIKESEDRLLQREESIDRRDQALQNREKLLDDRDNSLIQKQKEIQDKEVNLGELEKKQLEILENISGYSKEKAKQEIMKKVEISMNLEISEYIKERETNAKLEADKNAKNILIMSMQKYASDVTNEQTVTVVNLPNDEMKGRIIGREGRNIKTLETLTGIDLIIDDTPEAVILSGFDPVRREVARIALEKLILDGRIHPTRIEEMVEKAQAEVEEIMREAGEEACYSVNVHNLNPDLVRLLGKLKYRTSYGQNVLIHSIEVAHIAGLMASELGLDPDMAKRAGLLHDIGKAIDQEMEGSHVQIGVDLLKKYKECPEILNAVEAHHEDVEPTSITAILIQAADSISAARPGARKETLEAYIKRIEKLEEITTSFKGVDKSFAIQAGREVRIIVNPEDITDAEMTLLARDIAKKIESDVSYPGQIKVNIVRETRAIDYAK